MNPVLKNILAVVAGWLGGSIVNMGLVALGHSVFPIEGIDPNDMDALGSFLLDADLKYFIFPFLAHALGTLVGGVIAAFIAATHKLKMALLVGVLFLIGGILVSVMITAPSWFIAADLLLAYIPMAWIGGKIASKR